MAVLEGADFALVAWPRSTPTSHTHVQTRATATDHRHVSPAAVLTTQAVTAVDESAAPRSEMVDTAVKFLLNPKVCRATFYVSTNGEVTDMACAFACARGGLCLCLVSVFMHACSRSQGATRLGVLS